MKRVQKKSVSFFWWKELQAPNLKRVYFLKLKATFLGGPLLCKPGTSCMISYSKTLIMEAILTFGTSCLRLIEDVFRPTMTELVV